MRDVSIFTRKFNTYLEVFVSRTTSGKRYFFFELFSHTFSFSFGITSKPRIIVTVGIPKLFKGLMFAFPR